MDVDKALRGLYEEKKRLDAAIAALEEQLRANKGAVARAKRGRKSMSAEERLEVSKRMSKYWEARRAQARALRGESAKSSAAEQANSAAKEP